MDRKHKFAASRRAATVVGLAGTLTFAAAGCKRNQAQAPVAAGQDPAIANLAQPYTGGNTGGYGKGQTQVAGQTQAFVSQSSGESFDSQTPAPIIRETPNGTEPAQYYPVPQAGAGQAYNSQAAYTQDLPDAESAGEQALAESDTAPPPLPEYDQPPAPADDYLWTPGYWDYAQTGYFWVPGAWVAPPFYGALWTPPYWAYERGRYICHRGYWGPHVGYYGGINYGFGYIGFGYFGGYWHDHDFYYNRAVTNVNVVDVHNVYNRTVVYDGREYGPRPYDRVSYNGGRGGLDVQPRPQELAAMREAHYAALPVQHENRLAAQSNRSQFFAANQGRPAQAFAARPFGTVSAIAAAPREQPFNHPGAAGQPAYNSGRPGTPNQPAYSNGRPNGVTGGVAQPSQPPVNNRANGFNRPGGPANQPAYNNGRPGGYVQPGAPTQPAYNNGRPGELNRPGTPPQPTYRNNNGPVPSSQPAAPNQPAGSNGRFNGASQPGSPNQPAYTNDRTGQYNRPGTTPEPTYRVNNRPGTYPQPPAPNQPTGNGRPNTWIQPGSPNQPAYTNGRRGDFNRPAPAPQPTPNQPRPNMESQRPSFQPQPQPQPQFRPNPEAQRPAPTFTPQTRPQPAPQPQAGAPRSAPAPQPQPHTDAPRNGDHSHNH